jgi:transcriptional regulator with GAF, ATPase, and Fis domain
MDLSHEFRRIQSHPVVLPLALEILVEQARFVDRDPFLQQMLPKIADRVSARYAAVVRADAGEYRAVASWGQTRPLPTNLLGDSLDAEAARQHESWLAAPLASRDDAQALLDANALLVVESAMHRPDDLAAVDALAAAVGLALGDIGERHREQRRVRRLEAILEIAGQWNQNQDTESLLQQMAEMSTRLLGAERASIFLWDRTQHQLVGRPALGVEGGELRIPDNAGIVGQVVQSGEPRRVASGTPRDGINRDVDQKLGFRTRNLLCTPLRGRKGQIFGAFEMINKIKGDFTDEDEAALVELASHAAIALENSQHRDQLLQSRKVVTQQAAAGVQLIGSTPGMEQLRSVVDRVARTDLVVLILGENGTGKEVVSRMIHYLSARGDEPFVAVNCAALTETLLESELFGHEKGAFTDAHEARQGKFELASGGTLFLDEIGDLSLGGQAKLLRVLEEKVVVRVGGSRPIRTDARIIAATNQNLAEMVEQRRFREDLFFRLNVFRVNMPPLRERIDDIVPLAEHFLQDFSARARRKPPRLTAAAQKRLRLHPWPGNVRELRNLMERLAYLTPDDTIDADELDFIIAPKRNDSGAYQLGRSLKDASRDFQIEYVRRNIAAAGGNMSDAARSLGVHRSNLYRKMEQLGMTEGTQEADGDPDDDSEMPEDDL